MPKRGGIKNPKMCTCESPVLCCGFCLNCIYCSKPLYWAALESAYEMGTSHKGNYQWGDFVLNYRHEQVAS